MYDLVRKNRKEVTKFLEGQPNQRFTFVKLDDGDEYEYGEWLDPNNNDEECCPEDVAPFVTMSNSGTIVEYIVTDIFIDNEHINLAKPNEKLVCASLVAADDWDEKLDVPLDYLYGVSEVYIYEMLMDVADV